MKSAKNRKASVDLVMDKEQIYGWDTDAFGYARSRRGSVLRDQPDGKSKRIGDFEITYVDLVGAMTEGVDPLEVFDVSRQISEVSEAIYEGDGSLIPSVADAMGFESTAPQNLLLIDYLVLQHEYRGHGIGKRALKLIVRSFRSGAGLIAVEPRPLKPDEFSMKPRSVTSMHELRLDSFPDDRAKADRALRTYFRGLGFKKLNKQFMVMSADRAMGA